MDQKIRVWTVQAKDGGRRMEDAEVIEKDCATAPEMYARAPRIASLICLSRRPRRITSISFTPDGSMVAAGLFFGQVIFFAYANEGLRFFTQMDCRNKRGKFSKGRNVTGISFIRRVDGDSEAGSEMLVSINDSRIRLCDPGNFSICAKLKGGKNGIRCSRYIYKLRV